eukprot:2450309-Amphidinium_carterae.1
MSGSQASFTMKSEPSDRPLRISKLSETAETEEPLGPGPPKVNSAQMAASDNGESQPKAQTNSNSDEEEHWDWAVVV